MVNVPETHSRAGLLAVLPLLVGYALDLATKLLVVHYMDEGQRIEVLPPVLSWVFIRNSGAAFSIGEDYTWVFTIIQAVAAIVVVALLFRVRSKTWAITLGFLLAGILGNLTDRLLREPGFGLGHVIDFISVTNFAIFNIADSLIVCSMIFIAILVLRGLRMDGRTEAEVRAEEKAREQEEAVADEQQ